MFGLKLFDKIKLPKASTLKKQAANRQTHINKTITDIINWSAESIIKLSEKGGDTLIIELTPNKNNALINAYQNNLKLWCELDIFNIDDYVAVIHGVCTKFTEYEYTVVFNPSRDDTGTVLLEEQHIQVKWKQND